MFLLGREDDKLVNDVMVNTKRAASCHEVLDSCCSKCYVTHMQVIWNYGNLLHHVDFSEMNKHQPLVNLVSLNAVHSSQWAVPY